MNPSVRLYFPLLIPLLLIALRAEGSLIPWEGHSVHKSAFRFRTEVDHLTTEKNFGTDGTLHALPAGASVSRFDSVSQFTLGFTDHFTLFGRFHWLWQQVGMPDSTPTQTLSGSVFGLGDQAVGASYRVYDGIPGSPDFELMVQTQVELPAYSNTAAISGDHAYLGNGSIDWTTGVASSLVVFKGQKNITRLRGAFGFTHRTLGFSQALPWSFYLESEPRLTGLTGRVGAYGNFTLGNDSGSTTESRTFAGAGGSLLVNAINPSQFNAEAQVGLRFTTGTRLLGVVRTSLAGTNTPSFFTLGAAIELQLGKKGDTFERGRVSVKNEKSPSFVTYDLTAYVVNSRPELHIVKIDRGRSSGVRPGARFDLFKNPESGATLEASPTPSEPEASIWIARAECTHVRPGEAVLRITEYVTEEPVAPGFIARRIVE